MSEPLPILLTYQTPEAAMATRKPRVWPSYLLPFLLIAGMFAMGVAVVFGAYFYVAAGKTVPEGRQAFSELLGNNLFHVMLWAASMLVDVAAIVGCILLSPTPFRRRLSLGRPKTTLLACFIFAAGSIGFAQLFTFAQMRLHAHSRALQGITQVVARSTQPQFLSILFILAILGPLLEELLFRGYIQTRLIQRHGPILGILITSLLFGIFHVDLIQGTFAFLMGIMLGIIAYRTGSILPSMLCHIAINSTSVMESALHLNLNGFHSLLIASAIILPASLFLLWRMPMARPVVAIP